MEPLSPSPPQTPREAIGPVVQERVVLEGRTFHVLRPAEPDLLLDNPAVMRAFEHDEYMPYWADLWPAARMLSKVILRESWPVGLETLELGCGLGLPGVAALSKGLRVTFSDYDPTALDFAAHNARLNGFSDFKLLRLDWRDPPDLQYPLILGSDLFYEERNVIPVVKLLRRMLTVDGLCLISDQDRKPAPFLRSMLQEQGFSFTTEFARAGQPGLRVKGTIYRICKRTSDLRREPGQSPS